KLGLLAFFWLFPFPATWRWRSIRLIRLLGRWGMVDVFAITAILLASQTIGPLHATPRPGLFYYATGILTLMTTGLLMDRMARTHS
ncbi:MAG TPA: paraquat-inducible protein A, partial [Phycisphaerales bacterium]|nr:paraquat-inducible protein A [Phycisphaerales bacterium]